MTERIRAWVRDRRESAGNEIHTARWNIEHAELYTNVAQLEHRRRGARAARRLRFWDAVLDRLERPRGGEIPQCGQQQAPGARRLRAQQGPPPPPAPRPGSRR